MKQFSCQRADEPADWEHAVAVEMSADGACRISKFQLKTVQLFSKMNNELFNFLHFSIEFCCFEAEFDEILSEFRQKF